MRCILSSKKSKMREYRNKRIPEFELSTFGDFDNKEDDDDSVTCSKIKQLRKYD